MALPNDKKPSKLSAAQQKALLAKRLNRKAAAPAYDAIPQRAQNSPCPASFAQERLWFIETLQPGTAAYNIGYQFHLRGDLNAPALEQSLNTIVARHEGLRTCFDMMNGQVMQIIADEVTLPLLMEDLQGISMAEQAQQVKALVEKERQQPFDLKQAPLLRAKLVALSPQENILLLNMHHIISDGWSMSVFNHELSTLYAAYLKGESNPLPELTIQYADFAVWQRQWLQGEVLEQQLAYWQKQLGDNPPRLQLPTDHNRPTLSTFQGQRRYLHLPGSTLEALKRLSYQESSTLFMTLLAAFKVLLLRYTQQTDILIGTPLANRLRKEIEPLIGFFVNTLVLRTDLAENPTFRELLQRVRQVCLDGYAHQSLPFEKIVEVLKPERALNRTPFINVMFVLQNASNQAFQLEGITAEALRVQQNTAKFDLTLQLVEKSDGLMLVFEYTTDLFETATIERMAGHYQTLLESIPENLDTPLAQLPLLTDAEHRTLLTEWAGSQTNYPRNATIQRLFEAQAQQTPEAVALVFEGTPLTYRDLNHKANQLAHYLQSLGVKPGDLVGLCLERSLDVVVATLAILKAGGAYVPLDPHYPHERLAFMLADTQISVLITHQSLREQLPPFEGHLVSLDTLWPDLEPNSTANLTVDGAAEDLAYVMYTSGSTGQPKGVCVTHRNVVRLVKNTNFACLSPEETFLQFAPISFDAATFEIWGPLLNGGRLVIFPPQKPSLELLGQFIAQQRITTLWLTAGLFHQMVDHQLDQLQGVRQLLAGGDVLSAPHVHKVLNQLPQTRLINGYGPTENTTFTTCYPIPTDWPEDMAVPIGRPIANTEVYILDNHLQPVPVGIPGQLYAGGDGVARGYLNRPELTAEKFIANPFGPGRLYQTGDLARYRPDGNIEFLGRMDNQVKIRGFRIELGEIETVLSQHPAVEQSIVMAREDTPGDKRLVAYVVGAEASVPDLRQHLQQKLPDYMIPAAFVLLESLPINANGKVDRQALPAPDTTRPDLSEAYEAPEGEVELLLADIWQEVLRVEQIGRHDNFFELGGHSLLAVQIVSRLQQDYQIELALRFLFEYPTIAQLAPVVEEIILSELDNE
ncbi:MAG: amino acid adenylation domain-containing protein [Anaerolineae bacterium]|nr:amino acid adenylation domain-containing protein [Anaerolineae bacterium]